MRFELDFELRHATMGSPMNWLAHFYLSEPDAAFRVGNVLPDLASMVELAALPQVFQAGIRRHREIDAFTDSHPVVRRSIDRLGPGMRRFGGIVIDIAYDHFLARNWDHYSPVPLAAFAGEAYASLVQHWDVIPEEQRPRMAQMIVDNWLVSYSQMPCVGEALSRIGSRFRRPVDLTPAFEALQRDTSLFEKDFAEFFPELVAKVWPKAVPSLP